MTAGKFIHGADINWLICFRKLSDFTGLIWWAILLSGRCEFDVPSVVNFALGL